MTVSFVARWTRTHGDEIGDALKRIVESGAEFLLVHASGITAPHWREIVSFATKNSMVTLGEATLFASVGRVMYYGSNLQEILDCSASFVDRILRGASPANLPVKLPSRFDLILNLKTLRALGITVPREVLLQASELIE